MRKSERMPRGSAALRDVVLPGLLLAAGLLWGCGHSHYYEPYAYDAPYYEDCVCDAFGCDCTIVYYKDEATPDAPTPTEVW